jgi:hypothetical protein
MESENGAKRGPHHYHNGLYGMPVAQLYDIEKPYQASTATGVEEVLPTAFMPQAYAPSRSQVAYEEIGK